MNSGAGFRMFMDIAAIIQRNPGLNWPWIEENLEALGLKEFSNVCIALIEVWFGVKAPISYNHLEKDFVEIATEKIFANGIFGSNDKANKTNAATNAILAHGKWRAVSRVYIVARYMFPKYKHMRYISEYHFIDGRPWLLPAAWAYRFGRFLCGKTSGTRSRLEKVSTSNEIVDAREAELRMWGLM